MVADFSKMGLRGPKGAQQPTEEHAGRGYKCPNGALYSNVHDMAVFLDAITPVRPPGPPAERLYSCIGTSGFRVDVHGARVGRVRAVS